LNFSWPLAGLKSEFWFRAVHADGNFIYVPPPLSLSLSLSLRIDFLEKSREKKLKAY
jgi:hypothetical protein